ncbi:MAG: hypothetical protein ACK4YQ_16830 [Phenylobacterium sp.]|uniref:hypothetical protein n=1 Tax=Phenylobacterium sp. TaxID=1871053 RepID=UPI003919E6E5
MSMHRYATEAWGHVAEIAEMLGEEGTARLRKWFGEADPNVAKRAAVSFAARYRPIAIEFLSAQPARRRKLLAKYPEQRQQDLLCYCAAVWGARAAILLERADELTPGGSYRSTTQSAAEALAEAYEDERTFWPLPRPAPFPEFSEEFEGEQS